ncbi:MAG: NTP transferase domain-containing protein [Dehalococcoidia bacterium]|nr:NTP transferase domain-containing protein [Dehalococcoidia bacterium]
MREYNSPPVAVVLAAGAGTRLGAAQSRIPKPLTNLRGVPLLNRALHSVQAAGIERAVVVAGYRAELVEAQARSAATSLDLDVTVVTNPRWMTGNGSSLLAAAPHVPSRCIVVMADHLTPPSFLRLLVDSTEDAAGLLVVDSNPDSVHDLDDATKVRLTASRIVAIGKQLQPFDAVDTGAFLFDRRIFDSLRTASAAGHDELSAAVQRLADDGLMHAVPSDGSFWCDIDTPEDLAFASRALDHEQRQPIAASPEQAALAGK